MDKPSISLVLSGSGILYPYHVGAVNRISEEFKIESITGISGGAIVGASVASGYSPGEELIDLILDTLPAENHLLDFNWLPFWKWGLIQGKKIKEKFEKYYVPSFQETEIPLQIGAVNLNKQKHRIFSTKNTPEFSIATAVRASMTYPIAFEPVEIKDDYYVDGGIMSYFPVDIYGEGENVIGVQISPEMGDFSEINGIWEYLMSLIKSMMTSMTQESKKDAPLAKKIHIQGNQTALNLGISRSKAKELIDRGYKITDQSLKNE